MIASKDGSTSTMRKHLGTHHAEFLEFLEEERRAMLPKRTQTLGNCEGWVAATADNVRTFDDKVIAAVAKWIANDYLPLSVTQSEQFRALVNLLRPGTSNVATMAIKNRLAKMFLQWKGEIFKIYKVSMLHLWLITGHPRPRKITLRLPPITSMITSSSPMSFLA